MSQDSQRCPLCQQPNRCAVAAGSAGEVHCWCMQQTFPDPTRPAVAEALSRQRGSGCLCQACVQRLAALG